jgi:hypothetical protein
MPHQHIENSGFSRFYVNRLRIGTEQEHVFVVENMVARCNVKPNVSSVANYNVWTVVYFNPIDPGQSVALSNSCSFKQHRRAKA